MKTKGRFAGFLSVAVAVCAVLGLASSASAQTHNWSTTAPNLSWSDSANWTPTASVPGPGNTVRFELSVADAAKGTIIMDKDYSASSVDYVRFTGNEVVSIQNYLKLTSTTTALQIQNGSLGGANVSVPLGGTIDGTINMANEGARTPPTLNFTGGNWVAGNVKTESGNRQGGIIKVSSSTGTLTPGAVLVSLAPEPVANRPRFYFALDAAGVAPITFQHATDPIQFTGAAAGTTPFNLTVDASLYAGASVDIPLIQFTGAVTDTDRMFSAGNITISGAPAGKGAFVTQTNTGTTLTLADAGDWSGGATPNTSWATAGNWTGGNVPGLTLARAMANFPAGVTPVTVTLDGTSPTLAVLNINSGAAAASAYSIGQGSSGTINLGATSTGSANAAAQINVLQGTANAISAPVALNMDAQISAAASTSLAMSGPISGGFSLTKLGGGTLVLSGGANSYSGATIIEAGVLSVSTLANAGSNSDLGNYATPGAAGIVLKGGTLKYTGGTMLTPIDRGITITANSTVDVPIAGDMRLGSLALASVTTADLNVTGSGAGTSRLYIDSVTVPTSTTRRTGPWFKPATANLTIGSITGNGNFGMVGAATSTDNIITGPINLGRGYFDQTGGNDYGHIYGPSTAGNVWTIMSENTFDSSWYSGGGTIKIKSPGTLVGSQNVSYAFGQATNTVSWPGGTDKLSKYYNGNTVVQLLNDLSTSYEYKPGSRVSVRAGGGSATFLVDRQGSTATNQTHNLGPLWIHDSTDVIVNGNNGYGLTFDTVTCRDTISNQKITANTTLTLAGITKSGSGTHTLVLRGTGTTTVTGTVSQPGGAFNITKEGNGTLTLNGGGNYSGTTLVNDGKLFVNGDQTAASGNVSVSANATLGGTGTIGGSVTIAATGRLEFNLIRPAASHDKLELAATKTLTLPADGNWVLDITASGGATPGVYTLVTAPGDIIGSAPGTVNLPDDWEATVSISGDRKSLLLNGAPPSGAVLIVK